MRWWNCEKVNSMIDEGKLVVGWSLRWENIISTMNGDRWWWESVSFRTEIGRLDHESRFWLRRERSWFSISTWTVVFLMNREDGRRSVVPRDFQWENCYWLFCRMITIVDEEKRLGFLVEKSVLIVLRFGNDGEGRERMQQTDYRADDDCARREW